MRAWETPDHFHPGDRVRYEWESSTSMTIEGTFRPGYYSVLVKSDGFSGPDVAYSGVLRHVSAECVTCRRDLAHGRGESECAPRPSHLGGRIVSSTRLRVGALAVVLLIIARQLGDAIELAPVSRLMLTLIGVMCGFLFAWVGVTLAGVIAWRASARAVRRTNVQTFGNALATAKSTSLVMMAGVLVIFGLPIVTFTVQVSVGMVAASVGFLTPEVGWDSPPFVLEYVALAFTLFLAAVCIRVVADPASKMSVTSAGNG